MPSRWQLPECQQRQLQQQQQQCTSLERGARAQHIHHSWHLYGQVCGPLLVRQAETYVAVCSWQAVFTTWVLMGGFAVHI